MIWPRPFSLCRVNIPFHKIAIVGDEKWRDHGLAFADAGIRLREGGASVAVAYDGGQVTLPQTGGVTDAKYSDGGTTFYLDGDRALLVVGEQVFARGCVKR